MLPATGSTMTAAISAPRAAKSALDARPRSLYGTTERVARDAPGHAGASRARRAWRAPEPAFDQQAVGVAVVAALELDDLRRGLVNPRATRSALIVASVPDDRRTISIDGTARDIASANSTSISVGAPKLVPRAAAFAIASRTRGCAWPRISGPHEPT